MTEYYYTWSAATNIECYVGVLERQQNKLHTYVSYLKNKKQIHSNGKKDEKYIEIRLTHYVIHI